MLPKDPIKAEEYRKKLSASLKGKKCRLGIPCSDIAKHNISVSLRGRSSPMKGKHFSEEIVQKNKEGQRKYFDNLPKVQCQEIGCNEMVNINSSLGYCKSHSSKHTMRKYMKEHPEYTIRMHENSKIWKRNRPIADKVETIKKGRVWREKLKIEVFTHYSNGFPKCNNCGYSDMRALCLDHINDDGAEHRKKLTKNSFRGGNAVAVYIDVRRRGYPSGFQVLCHNCNRIKEYKRQRIKMREWDEKHTFS